MCWIEGSALEGSDGRLALPALHLPPLDLDRQSVERRFHAAVVLLEVLDELGVGDRLVVVHAQVREVDLLRVELEPLLDALLDGVVVVRRPVALPEGGVHREHVDAADALGRLGGQARGVARVEQARLGRLDEVAVGARRVRDGAGGVAHAVELVRLERLERVEVERVGHVVELLRDARERVERAVRGQLLLPHELHEVLVLAEPADVVEVRVGEQDLVDVAHVLAQQLVARIGRRVDDERLLAAHHDAAVAAAQCRVGARLVTGGAVAEEGGHTAAGGGAHEGETVCAHGSLRSRCSISHLVFRL